MPDLEWAVACDHAYLDSMDRLCVLGVMRQLPALGLPDTMTRLTLVAKVTNLLVVEQFDVSLAIVSPSGLLLAADHQSEAISIQLVQDYVIVIVRGMPITEAGRYTFQLRLEEQSAIDIELPVIDVTAQAPTLLH